MLGARLARFPAGNVLLKFFNRQTSSGPGLGAPAVVVSQDGSTIFCWHPEPKFPYEHSTPIVRTPDTIAADEASSVLKTDLVMSELQRLKPHSHLPPKELSKMFFTTRHEWRPRPGKKKAKQTKADRDGM